MSVFNIANLSLLISLLVTILPMVISIVGKVEDMIKGIKMGAVKKVKAMELIEQSLDTKNLLLSIFGIESSGADPRVMQIVDPLIDTVVFAANLFGFFETTVRIDTRPEGGDE